MSKKKQKKAMTKVLGLSANSEVLAVRPVKWVVTVKTQYPGHTTTQERVMEISL